MRNSGSISCSIELLSQSCKVHHLWTKEQGRVREFLNSVLWYNFLFDIVFNKMEKFPSKIAPLIAYLVPCNSRIEEFLLALCVPYVSEFFEEND